MLTELGWGTSKDGHWILIDNSRKRCTLSWTSDFGSGSLSKGVDSSVASAESRWSGLVLGWVKAEISVTAASSDSWFWGSTPVVHVEGLADSGWVTSIEYGGVDNSSNCGVQSNRCTLSLASSKSDWSGWLSIDVESGVTSNGEVSGRWWWWWCDGCVGDVTVVNIVTAASVDLIVIPDWFAVIIELKSVTDRVWNAVVGVDSVSVDNSRQR